MIELSKTSGTISVPVNTVFNYVTNMDYYGDWFPGVQGIKSKNSLPHASVGKTYSETLLLPDGEHELTIEVVKCETNQFFLTKGNLTGVLPQMTIKFEADEENKSRIELQYHSRSSTLTESSDIIVALKKDLTDRASKGISNLQTILEEKA
ncbi:hypothetical protein [Paraglaciecola sp.]|uniref:hypothetical protein n=1 Tax=Paraglaciecola sp. TaxID=1920173 RepID=UPI003EF8B4D4